MSSKDYVVQATEQATHITPSVIALATAAGISPKQFAKALRDDEVNGQFLVDLSSELAKLLIDEARQVAKKTK